MENLKLDNLDVSFLNLIYFQRGQGTKKNEKWRISAFTS